ncbi:response regulator [Roseateles amylovorans]|uniref:Response regulator transcription factor n=1 Tax=Roseateles amylovorans TaxID=2978473 RepID=A0ABY6AV25_9BURK|nr:response regulator transcription factor [Roseateles amylovorans]UXH76778.1 response regulator transcription factor [Roseateles amylovorans]
MERPIRLMVVDDHPMVRTGISAITSAQPDMTVVAEAEDGLEAVELFTRHQPDVTLMDLQMPRMSGIAAMERILKQSPSARIVVLTTYRGDVQAMQALKTGACGYLLKNTVRKELVAAVREVHAGRRYIAPEMARELSLRLTDESLSNREVEVIGEVAAGGSNKQVADRLGVSEETVKSHMKSILGKLGASDRVQAVVIAMRRGILNEVL